MPRIPVCPNVECSHILKDGRDFEVHLVVGSPQAGPFYAVACSGCHHVLGVLPKQGT
jgi:hypothetical protein